MRYTIILLVVLIISCGTINKGSNEFIVEYKGALKNIMHNGDISAKANLSDFEHTEHFYALGAIENLKGEIQIFNSEGFNTMVDDKSLTFDKSFSKKATLLVYTSVSEWQTLDIPDKIVTYEQLESYIGQKAKENNLKTDEPFPFLIEGTALSIDWHVINWKDGDKEHSHAKHINSGLHGTLRNRSIEILGFYSDSHHAIFTHHTTNMHLHLKTVDNKIAGHVDGLTLGKGMILKLPDIR